MCALDAQAWLMGQFDTSTELPRQQVYVYVVIDTAKMQEPSYDKLNFLN